MPLSSLLLALVTIFSAQGRRDTTLVVPPSPQVQPFAPADSQWQHLVELEDSHKKVRSLAYGTALGGAALLTLGTLTWTFNDLFKLADTTNADGPLYTFTAWTLGLGTACEFFAAGAGIYSLVLSHRVEDYEHRTRYRITLRPLLVPEARATGLIARVQF